MAREKKKETTEFRGQLRRIGLSLCGVALIGGIAVYCLHRYAIHDPQFLLSHERRDWLTLDGLHYGSRAKVLRVFAQDVGRSVFSVPLDERRRRLLAIDWVDDAAVSRVWPDRLVVRIRERQPVAFVDVQSSVMLIDTQGMLLEPPPQAQFSFPVLSGIRDDDSQARRMEAVRALLTVEDELGPRMKDVSEVNAADPSNIRILAQLEGRVAELILGDDNRAQRYENFLNHYAEIRKRSPEVRVFDLRLDDRITAKE